MLDDDVGLGGGAELVGLLDVLGLKEAAHLFFPILAMEAELLDILAALFEEEAGLLHFGSGFLDLFFLLGDLLLLALDTPSKTNDLLVIDLGADAAVATHDDEIRSIFHSIAPKH